MKVSMTTESLVTPKELAAALVNAEPWEFSAVWLEFYQLLKKDDDDGKSRINQFAEKMAPKHGSACQKPLRELLARIDYLIIKNAEIEARES